MLYGTHEGDLLGGVLQREHVGLALAQTVLGGDGAAERDGVTREFQQESVGGSGIGGVGK